MCRRGRSVCRGTVDAANGLSARSAFQTNRPRRPSDHSVSKHLTAPAIALTRGHRPRGGPSASRASDVVGLGFATRRQARQTARPRPTCGRCPVHFRYGLVILLQLLPTPCHQDAVTFRYRPESVFLKRTCTSLTKHTYKRTILLLKATRPVPNILADAMKEVLSLRGFSRRVVVSNILTTPLKGEPLMLYLGMSWFTGNRSFGCFALAG
jgi:hypothetical protein